MHERSPIRFIELLTTDDCDDASTIHPDHIGTIEAWPDGRDRRRGWLEVTLTSGRVRFVPVTAGHDLHSTAGAAIRLLLEPGCGPVAAAR